MANEWPELAYAGWVDTKETLHRWTQIVGKIRMELTPLLNHWWNVPLYVSARGLTTSKIPLGERCFDMELDFVSHLLRIRTSDGAGHEIALEPKSVAAFYAEVLDALRRLRIDCEIWPTPVEIDIDPIPFDRDEIHCAYDPRAVERFWRVLVRAGAVFNRFRGEFIGKCSPVHFFWGSFDLAVTRFSGRRAPAREGLDPVTAEAYSHEVSSVGFWPGDHRLELPAFYAYAAPEPDGFRGAPVMPSATYYNEALGGFYLHYDELRRAADPEATLLDYCRSTYEAAANAGAWDRDALERRS